MKHLFLTLLALLLLLAVFLSLALGKYQLPLTDIYSFLVWKISGHGGLSAQQQSLLTNILLDIRLPRILAALLIGSTLSVSGTAFQALFINPLVSPGLLGVLAGASFGAALGMICSQSWLVVQCSTLFFGFCAVGLAVVIARIFQASSIIMLVLGGIISGAFFTASLSIIKYTADPANQLPAIVYWLMGNLAAVDGQTIAVIGLPMLAGIGILIVNGERLNVMSMGEEEARALGIRVDRVRLTVIFLATLISALTVVIGGIIGWVGLIIPHICRMLVGPDNRLLLPAAALTGALYLLAVDNVSRLAFSFEIPTGIVTSLIGIPFFVLVLKNAQRGWK
ncbi:iron ABC transporter permease [Desulfobulbus rhabdoformis]|uniref:FecCD family ABC transporter permease n=1 Tax=Desulfobulbus rhabdoformis TaxID=34032 RepID=UPI001964BA87|nr:iron ABC transporter permease [Desulfobulbus rhabdoformis]MBM9615526.1 iron ABC transporter permease [Desulfobulbus rhabdoformis]